MEAQRRAAAVDDPLRSVRIRSEGALEVVEQGTAAALAVCNSLEEPNWHLRLDELRAFAPTLGELDESYEKLEAMAARDGWSAEHEATRTLHDFVAIIARLREVVARRLRESGIDGGAAELDDAIAQLVARTSVKRPQWTLTVVKRARFGSMAVLPLAAAVAFLVPYLVPGKAGLLATGAVVLALNLTVFLLFWFGRRVSCPRCGGRFQLSQSSEPSHPVTPDTCPLCGLRL